MDVAFFRNPHWADLDFVCSRVRPTHSKGSLGFHVVGWTAYRVTNADEGPPEWIMKRVAEKRTTKVIMASAALCVGRLVYFLANSEPEHDLYLARLDVESVWTTPTIKTAHKKIRRKCVPRDAPS